MNNATLIQSRASLIKAANKAMLDLTGLGWAILDGRATREDALEIAAKLADAIDANSADTLDDMINQGKH